MRPLRPLSGSEPAGCIRFRQCITICTTRALDCCRFLKKNSEFGKKKKHSEKDKFISGDKKHFFQLCFLLLFSVALITFFYQMDQIFIFILWPTITFLEICSIFFLFRRPHYLFQKNMFNVFFFLNVSFVCPPSLEFDFFFM